VTAGGAVSPEAFSDLRLTLAEIYA